MLKAGGVYTFGATGWRPWKSQKFTIKNVNFYSLACINNLICHSWNYYHSRQEIPATLVRSVAPLTISIFKMEFKSQSEELSPFKAKRLSYHHYHLIVGYQNLYVGYQHLHVGNQHLNVGYQQLYWFSTPLCWLSTHVGYQHLNAGYQHLNVGNQQLYGGFQHLYGGYQQLNAGCQRLNAGYKHLYGDY